MGQRPLYVVMIISSALLLFGTTARAETSSWSSRVDGPAAPLPKKAPGAGTTPKLTTPPKVQVIPQTAGTNSSTIGKTVLPLGEDAAYEAYDQGRFLTALELATKAAEKGDPQAHTLMGRIYAEGQGVPQNLGLAAKSYARGAELGDPEAMFAYALLLAEGRGVEKSRPDAARLFEAAAAHKHPLANYNLALLFLKGEGKPENPYRAAMHMTFAAEAGVAAAQYDLGTLYATGLGVDPNAFEAARWIGKAAAAGHPEAQLDYAVILFRGHGVAPDPKRGAELFRAAADKGVVVAQNRLARCYVHGAGVETNLVEAAKWHLIAKAGGLEDDTLEKAIAKLSKADRAKAQKAAEEWREKAQAGFTE